ncbi:hypothetical protein [Geminisphaera colitermitum]|nr:hypothetical protein [Geminisphaera colitermitum]
MDEIPQSVIPVLRLPPPPLPAVRRPPSHYSLPATRYSRLPA